MPFQISIEKSMNKKNRVKQIKRLKQARKMFLGPQIWYTSTSYTSPSL